MFRTLFLAALLLASSAAATSAATGLPQVSFRLLNTVKPAQLGQGPLALSPDGTRMAILDQSRPDMTHTALVLREVGSGRELWRVPSAQGYGGGVTFSPDGRTLLVLGDQATAYDADTGKLHWQLGKMGQSSSYGHPVFSPDGNTLMLSSLEKYATPHLLRLDLATGKTIWDAQKVFTATKGPDPVAGLYNHVTAQALSPAGDLLVTGSFGGGLVLRRASDGAVLQKLTDAPVGKFATQAAKAGQTAHNGMVLGLAFLPDGTLISGANDGTLKRWDIKTGQRLGLALLPGGVQQFVLAGQKLLAVTGRSVTEVSLPDLRLLRTFSGHTAQITDLAVSGGTLSGAAFWTHSNDGTTKRWSLQTGQETETYGPVRAAAVSPDGKTFALNLGDSTVRLTDAQGHLLRVLRGFEPPSLAGGLYVSARSLAFSPDGKTLAGGIISNFHMTVESYTSTSAAHLWNVQTGERRTWKDFPGEVVSFSPSGQQLLGLSQQDGSVARYGLRRVADGKVLATPCEPLTKKGERIPSCPMERVLGAGWVGSAARLLTQQTDGQQPRPPTFVRDALSGKALVNLGPTAPNVAVIGVSPDGQRIVRYGDDGLNVWNGGGKWLKTWSEVKAPMVYGLGPVQFSPDGRFFTVADPLLSPPRLFDGRTGAVLGTLNEKVSPLGFLRGQAGEMLLATSSSHNGVQMWRVGR